jgi:muconate cycloisomerase
MQIQVQTFTVNKRFPLTISRGTTTQTTNVWVRVEHEEVEGWGEASPFSVGDHRQSTEVIVSEVQRVKSALEAFSPLERQKIEQVLTEAELLSAAWAALDLALHDWLGKQVGLPLWRLWGLDRDEIVPTSVTIGINPPEVAQQQVHNWLYGQFGESSLKVPTLKVKLGSPMGIAADQAMLMAVQKAAPTTTRIYVDANGGWNLSDAVKMCHWLAGQGVKYVEQPLPRGQEESLPELYQRSPLPIFVDESCFISRDIPQLADRVHGVNIKLMKCGGLTEAIRMVHTAQACGLQVMFGCYSDSSLANTAAAHLSPLADYIDLDSHLNLVDDPFTGASVQNGRILPNDLPGLGVRCHAPNI